MQKVPQIRLANTNNSESPVAQVESLLAVDMFALRSACDLVRKIVDEIQTKGYFSYADVHVNWRPKEVLIVLCTCSTTPCFT